MLLPEPMTEARRKKLLEQMHLRSAAEQRQQCATAPDRVDYYLGLHLAKHMGRSALAVVEQRFSLLGLQYTVSHLEHFLPGTPYKAIAAKACAVYADRRIQEAFARMLVIDASTVGLPLVYETFPPEAEYIPYEVSASGDARHGVSNVRALTGLLQTLLQGRALRVVNALPEAEGLMGELRAFRGGNAGPRVLAVALACWHGDWWKYAAWPQLSQ